MKTTQFKITKDIRRRIREIIPAQTDKLEIVRSSANCIKVYAVWNGIRIAQATWKLNIGDSFFINDTLVDVNIEEPE